LTVFKEFTYFIGLPFGVCYSCYWAFDEIFIYHDPEDDGSLTEEEILTELLTIGHEIPTNLFYNIGYMCGDIWQMYFMDDSTKDYWQKFGRYIGDFVIRIFWRRSFTKNFDYGDEDE